MAKAKKRRGKQGPPKLPNVIQLVHERVEAGRYLDTRHGSVRQSERLITRLEILDVLRRGRHVPSRDRYEEGYGNLGWSYAIEGKTLDNRHLRVIVAFDEEINTLIVTAIDLEAG